MTTLTMDEWDLPTAPVGPDNPLPPLLGDASLNKRADLTAAPAEMRANAGYGRVTSISPYLMQDGYSRRRHRQRHRVIVVQNEHLRASFLPGLGGRLYSLVDRRTGRELLYANPIVQPANLALRNAWVAGGVEWNIGTIGHTPLTCAPLFAARVDGDGYPVLRLYEFERMRGVVYQLDVHLPPDSQALYVHVRIANPHDRPVPMYWWSNIAVQQTAGTRVLVPAGHSWTYSYDHVLRYEPIAAARYDDVPGPGGPGGTGPDQVVGTGDISYPARFSDAADFFFDLDEAVRPWIAAVDEAGFGLLQTSTAEMRGRKLFRWGTGPGGRRWQEWLSGPLADPLGGYAEIQSGLARTQFEHVPMPAGAVWSWTESYGPIRLPAGPAHGPWPQARAAAAGVVETSVQGRELAIVHTAAGRVADRAPDELLHLGSGWGALEAVLCAHAGEPGPAATGTPFPDASLGAEQQPWLDLLHTGRLPDPAPGAMPTAVHLHPVLTTALERSAGWAAAALLGVARAADGDWPGAREAWQTSLTRRDNPYARRNLAVADRIDGAPVAACEQYETALGLLRADPDADPAALRATVIEALTTFLDAGDPGRALALLDTLPADIRGLGRVRLCEARAALAASEIDRCGRILTDPRFEVPDLREGEDSLDRLWWDYQAARLAAERGTSPGAALRNEAERTVPLPARLDFRMRPSQD